MATRREVMERAEARLSTRADAEGSIEATRCFLRAMLVGIDEEGAVPDDLVARIADLLKIDREELFGTPVHAPALRRKSTRPPPSVGPRRQRILVLGRADAARLPMLEAVLRATFADEADVRGAALSPAPLDPRALRVLRLAGYATDALVPRALAVDDMTWGDLVVTVSGEREDWERLLPRNLEHVHELIEDPAARARDLAEVDDQSEPYRSALRAIERLAGQLRAGRSVRLPAARNSSTVPRASSFARAPSTPPPRFGAEPATARPALGRRPTPPPASVGASSVGNSFANTFSGTFSSPPEPRASRASQQLRAVKPTRQSQSMEAIKDLPPPDEGGGRGRDP
jgi:protein-tyrosine-phosphatase